MPRTVAAYHCLPGLGALEFVERLAQDPPFVFRQRREATPQKLVTLACDRFDLSGESAS